MIDRIAPEAVVDNSLDSEFPKAATSVRLHLGNDTQASLSPQNWLADGQGYESHTWVACMVAHMAHLCEAHKQMMI